jgi:hypothetical protein
MRGLETGAAAAIRVSLIEVAITVLAVPADATARDRTASHRHCMVPCRE